MLLCGNIYVESGKFVLKCTFCETQARLYTEFVKHIRNKHKHDERVSNCTMGKIDLMHDEECKDPMDNRIEQPIDMGAFQMDEIMIKPLEQHTNVYDICEKPPYSDDDDDDGDHVPVLTEDENDDNEEKQENEDFDITGMPTYTEKFMPTFFKKKRYLNEFIDMYKNQMCLWNVNDPLFENESARRKALFAIIQGMRRYNVHMKEKTLEKALNKLHKLCARVKNALQSPSPKKIANLALGYYKRCEFLNELIDRSNISTVASAEVNKLLNFQAWDETTLTFINCYAEFPILYNAQHENYNNVNEKQRALEELKRLLHQHNMAVGEDELMRSIDQLQVWYYKTRQRFKNSKFKPNEVETRYFKHCKFMPDERSKKRLTCTHCEKIFKCFNTLRVHQYKDHNIGELPFKCEECNRTFEQNSTLTVHRQRFHVGKTHQCQYCERRFAVKSDLNVHIRIHTAEKPHVCDQCGKSFRLRTQLGYHVTAIHTKTRAFKCTICPKDFLKKRDLDDHVKRHMNIRDKICETCGKGFSNCHSLIRHRQIHSEIKKFACKLCDARFKQFVGLSGHMKRTHNIVKRDNVYYDN